MGGSWPVSPLKTREVTFMSLYGEEKCASMVARLTGLAVELAGELGSDFLAELASRLSDRRS